MGQKYYELLSKRGMGKEENWREEVNEWVQRFSNINTRKQAIEQFRSLLQSISH